jgi:AbrB family looped-hinge helix DNA binding protein
MLPAPRLTSKGQVTIPIAIRKKLGLKPHDQVVFEERDENTIVIRKAADLLSLAGSLAYEGPPLDWRQLREEFEAAVVEDALKGVR